MTLRETLDTDLLIAGGSTAGLATAIYARLAGLRCIIVEPRQGVLDKPCGEGFMPSALTLLQEMGITSVALQPFAGISYHAGSRSVRRSFSRGHGGGIRRHNLNAAMQDRARSLGVQFVTGRVSSYVDKGSRVEAAGISARWLVGCDGLRSQVCRQMQVGLVRRCDPRFGLRQHFRTARCPTDVEVYWQDGYEVYVTPVASDSVNIAVLFGREPRSIEACLIALPHLRADLGEPLSNKMGAGPFEHRVITPRRGNVFLAGDAAGFLDPITGEGNQLAMAAARELVLCLTMGRPEAYPARWRTLSRGYWLLTSSLLWLRRQAFCRRLLVPTLQKAPALFDLAFHTLSYRPVGFASLQPSTQAAMSDPPQTATQH